MDLSMLSQFCESPIEVQLANAIAEAFADFELANVSLTLVEPCTYDILLQLPAEGAAFVIPQAVIEAEGEYSYRIDFLFVCGPTRGTRRAIAVECDGHDWHEKTKEQAARDKLRDRRLLEDRIPTVRFAGSEIHADAATCAEYLVSLVHSETGSALEKDWRASRGR